MESSPSRPTGTVTFLFTDIEGSTRLWEQHPQAMEVALARHDALAAAIIQQHQGTVVKHRGEGDSLFAVFPRAIDAMAAATDLQRTFKAESWPERVVLRVRMALHTGDATLRDGDYFGAAVNRCARLRAVAYGGQVLLSHATRELIADHLPEGITLRDLGLHRLPDLARPEHVFQILHRELPGEFPPLRSLDTRPNNLPAQPTLLVGREQELVQVRDLLRHDHARLLTLTGSGGTGKTRLALQLAADLLDEFQDGVFFVELAPVSDPSLVASTIAQTLGVRESGGTALLESLKDYLREKQLLLVLDNFEQILGAAAQVADLLAAAPRLKALVTSREILHLRGEQEFAVAPLPVPHPRQLPPVECLSQYAAVELFIQRALNVKPGFTVTNENAFAVAEICHRLDGLPLAIELAAARVRMFPPQALLSHLDNPLKLLTGGARDLPARQQTLRNAIGWSYDLLDTHEQKLFRRLSVFVGGLTLESAEQVCDAEGDLQIDVLDEVASLVDKSLLRQEEQPEAEPRYRMLETVREFGQECLALSGEETAIRRRHLDQFLKLAERAAPELSGRDQREWLDRLEREHDNLRAALRWSAQVGALPGGKVEAEAGLRLGGALWKFWNVRGLLEEGRQWLKALLELRQPTEQAASRATALYGAAELALSQGDAAAAWPLLEESLALAREVGDTQTVANVLTARGKATRMGEIGDARPQLEEALAFARKTGDTRSIADALSWLGSITAMLHDDFVAARPLLEESLALRRNLGDKWEIAGSLNSLASIPYNQGDYRTARTLYEEGLSIARELGDKRHIQIFLCNLADMVTAQGDAEAAHALYEEALVIAREVGNRRNIAHVLNQLGRLLIRRGKYESARVLLEEALSFACEVNDGWRTRDALCLLRDIDAAQGGYQIARHLHEEDLARARERGGKQGIAVSLGTLANVHASGGKQEMARVLLEEGLEIWRELGNRHRIAGTLKRLGEMARLQGDYEGARRFYAEGLTSFQAIGGVLGIVGCLEGFARLAIEEPRGGEQEAATIPEAGSPVDQHERTLRAAKRAARLLGVTARLREVLSAPIERADRPDYERGVTSVRAVLNADAWMVAWTEGQAMTRDQAIDYALEEPEADADSRRV